MTNDKQRVGKHRLKTETVEQSDSPLLASGSQTCIPVETVTDCSRRWACENAELYPA
jgi:hypothetical protein